MESTRTKKQLATPEVPEADPSDRFQSSHSKKVFRHLQDNQEADHDNNYKKSFNRDHIIYPS